MYKQKLSKKQKEARAKLLKEQREIARSLKNSYRKKEYVPTLPSAYRENIVPSLQTNKCNTVKKESKQYTGTVVIGIAQTHKSNAVPIINQQHAIDIAKMRRQ